MSEFSLYDEAKDVLANAADLSDDQRADAWDAFYDSKDPEDLAKRLTGVPDAMAQALLTAKSQMMPEVPHGVRAVEILAKIDPAVLDLAEQHPKVLQNLIDAVRRKK